MSGAASDCQTDDELEDLGEDALSIDTFISNSEKKAKKKRTSCKPPSPKSPYLTSANLHPKKGAAWRSLKGAGNMQVDSPAVRVPRDLWVSSLKSGLDFDVAQVKRPTTAGTPEYLKEAFGMKKPKYSRSSSNGYIPGTPDFKEKEDMYDEIIELKKCLQAQKSENDVMKTKLRRVEEDNIKKEKQIEQLLDPTKGPEHTRALVDKKSDIVNGLKQKILRLEQQCRERDVALSKLRSDLKTTNIEELKIMAETYYEEVQRLRVLLATAEATEKSRIAESKGQLKQQKVLNTTILKLSKNIKKLEEDNALLQEDVRRAVESPVVPATGYADWSKQRLIKRIIELEKKTSQHNKDTDLGGGAKASHTITDETDGRGMPAGTSEKDAHQECARLRELVKELKEERASLQDSLADSVATVKQQEEQKAEAERLMAIEHNEASQRFREETEELHEKIRQLEERCLRLHTSHDNSQSVVSVGDHMQEGAELQQCTAEVPTVAQCKPQNGDGEAGEQAARTVQRQRQQTNREDKGEDCLDIVLIQSAIRGHLTRQKPLKITDVDKGKLPNVDKTVHSVLRSSAGHVHVRDGDEDANVLLLQSAFRGHLSRCGLNMNRCKGEAESLSPASRIGGSISRGSSKAVQKTRTQGMGSDVEDMSEVCADEKQENSGLHCSSLRRRMAPAQLDLHQSTSAGPAQTGDSDDSDDIIISPSRPLKRGDSYF